MIVFLSADNIFIQHTTVTIRSLLCNASAPKSLKIKLINDGISHKNLNRLRESLSDFKPLS